MDTVFYLRSTLLAVRTESMTTEYLYMCFIDILESKQKLMNGPDYIQQNNFILCSDKNIIIYYTSSKTLCILFIQMGKKNQN